MAKNIKSRAQDYNQWYLDVIKAARLADYAPVKGCMVIRPEGYAIWEAIQRQLDKRFKETGHVNAYFPLLIPQSFLTKEAEHVEGFALECAVVTHTRLERGPGGLKPGSPLEEPLIIRPTSETIIGHMYAEWVQSYRDLPLLINQWCNVMRWEMRTRLFLRTAEFLWQEGHTAHETEKEAVAETMQMLDVYAQFAEEVLAIPVLKGSKTDSEKFPGAVTTYCIEGLMQDGKALQCGTSHYLGQNFSKAFDIKFLGRDQQQSFVYTTSWGVSTRLIGAMIMAHSDDEGLVLPPRVAPIAAAVVPIYKSPEDLKNVIRFVNKLLIRLLGQAAIDKQVRRVFGADGRIDAETGEVVVAGGATPTEQTGVQSWFINEEGQSLVIDYRDLRPGDKQYHWEQRGVPFRMEIGPRDVEGGAFVLKSRIGGTKDIIKVADLGADWLKGKLEAAHVTLYNRALAHREANTRNAATYDELKKIVSETGGFIRCYFKPDRAAEAKIKEETKATVRCIPFTQPGVKGKCIYSGEETDTQVIFATAY